MNKDTENNPTLVGGQRAGTHQRISTTRLWLFRIIALVVIPALALVLLELILRVVGCGYPAGTFVRRQVNGRSVYCGNNKFAWCFFPPQLAREFPPFVVPADKTGNTYRIFILGESAALGDPDPFYGFGQQLRVMLRRQYPSVNFEVFTAAMVAINSHAIVRIAEDCARLKPDLFIVYAGNNEVVGPYGAGTVFSPLSKNLFLIRLGIAVKTTRVGQLMTHLADVTSRIKAGPKAWRGLEMFLGKQIRHDDEQMKFVYSHFRRNLEDILRIAQNSGANAIVSTVAVNIKDCPPFASLHRPDLAEQKKRFDDLYQNGLKLEKASDLQGAIDNYLAAARIDDTYAELQFRIGRCQWNLGLFDEAKQRYARALELDTLRFRADSSINRIIRQVGENRAGQGVYFVDAAGEFAQQSPHNCPGFEFFLEHVHLNFSGNYLLARIMFDRVDAILPDRIKARKTEDAGPASTRLSEAGPPGESQCAELLAFTNYDKLNIAQTISDAIKNKPFADQAYHDEITDFWGQKTKLLKAGIGPDTPAGAVERYEQAIKLDGSNYWLRLNYAMFLQKVTNNVAAAVEQYRLVVEQMPNDHWVLATLAGLELTKGDVDSALKHALMAAELMPAYPPANYIVGITYQKKGQYKEAKRYLVETIRLNPAFAQAYVNLGNILRQQGRTRQAERCFQKGIRAVPNSAPLHFSLALLLREKGLFFEAEEEQRKAILLDPSIAAPHR